MKNFCEIYNRIMNWYTKILMKFGDSSWFFYEHRNNRTEINIIAGLTWLAITPIYIIVIVMITFVYNLYHRLSNITTSKCSIRNRTELDRTENP